VSIDCSIAEVDLGVVAVAVVFVVEKLEILNVAAVAVDNYH
jgi:hypothetical protein